MSKAALFDWETHQKITIPRHALGANGGLQPSGCFGTADYKGVRGTQNLSYGVCSYPQCGPYKKETVFMKAVSFHI